MDMELNVVFIEIRTSLDLPCFFDEGLLFIVYT